MPCESSIDGFHASEIPNPNLALLRGIAGNNEEGGVPLSEALPFALLPPVGVAATDRCCDDWMPKMFAACARHLSTVSAPSVLKRMVSTKAMLPSLLTAHTFALAAVAFAAAFEWNGVYRHR